VAAQAIQRIAWLYRIEAGRPGIEQQRERLRMRQERAQPLWNELYVWMRLERTRVADGGGIAAALVSFESALTPLRYWELCGCQLPQEPVFYSRVIALISCKRCQGRPMTSASNRAWLSAIGATCLSRGAIRSGRR
jgi:hypothetical protein